MNGNLDFLKIGSGKVNDFISSVIHLFIILPNLMMMMNLTQI